MRLLPIQEWCWASVLVFGNTELNRIRLDWIDETVLLVDT